jgi:hypothetical protein
MREPDTWWQWHWQQGVWQVFALGNLGKTSLHATSAKVRIWGTN